MALEDQFVEEDVQDLEARFERIDREYAITRQRRIVDWSEDLEIPFLDDDDY